MADTVNVNIKEDLWGITQDMGESFEPVPLLLRPYLIFLEGSQSGHRVDLTDGEYTVGRSSSADIRVADNRASSTHCRLTVEGLDLTVEDLGSRNGTIVDGEKVEKAQLTSTSQLWIGHALLRVGYRSEREVALELALNQMQQGAAVGILAGGIAHQFNNALTEVVGYADLALIESDLCGQTREYVEQVKNSSLRIRDIIDRLLTACGCASGRKSPLGLDDIVNDALALIETKLADENIALHRSVAKVPLVSMSAGHITQIFLALVQNAQHALLDRPEKKISVTVGHAGSSVWLKVADTGCGIPDDDLERVFLPFFTTKGEFATPGSPQEKVRGLGLGLSQAQTLVRQHTGSLTLKSDFGKGSQFVMTLPARQS